MRNIMLIAGNAFRQVLGMRLTYGLLLAGFLVLVLIWIQMSFFELVEEAGEEEMMTQLRAMYASTLWYGSVGMLHILAITLGAVMLPGEVRQRTILSVLSRPVERWQLMLGKLVGVAAFLMIIQCLSILVCLATLKYYGWELHPLFGYAVVYSIVAVLVSLVCAICFGALWSSGTAIIMTFLLLFMLPWLADLGDMSSNSGLRTVLGAIGTILPSTMDQNLIEATVTLELLEPRYLYYAAVIGENALFAFAMFCVFLVLFRRREILVRV